MFSTIFFLLGFAGNLKDDPPTLGLQFGIVYVGTLIGTEGPEFIRIIHIICMHKTLEFEDDIIHN